jgi:VWFA-related protein
MSLATRLSTIFLLGPTLLASAQAPSTKPAPLTLDITVTNKSGAAIPNLQQSDFTILVNKLPQPILAFHPVDTTKEPLSVILVLDAVNTSYQEIAFERGQLETFLSAADGQLAHPTTIAILTDKGIQVSDGFTRDGRVLRDGLDKQVVALRTITRSSGFYGAQERVSVSLNGLDQLVTHESAIPGRKLILFLSPGWPLLSGAEVDLDGRQQQRVYRQVVQLSGLLRSSRVALYALNPYGASENLERVLYYQSFLDGLRKPSDAALGDLSLQVLAIQSGGLALNSTGLTQLIERCIAENSTYYRIAIAAPTGEHPDDYKSLQVQLSSPALTAHTSTGVYVQP